MKHKSIYKFVGTIFLIVESFLCYGQQSEDTMSFASLSNDRLYFNEIKYTCVKSPLCVFDNYTKIYPACPKGEEIEFSEINDKNYKAFWTIKDNLLYLCDVEPLCLPEDSFKIRYKQIEKLTGLKFQKPKDLSGFFMRTDNGGVMFAFWFSDSLYIKRRYRDDGVNTSSSLLYKKNYESYEEYKKSSPTLLIVFRKGRVLKVKEVKSMPIEEYLDAFVKMRDKPISEEMRKVFIHDLKNNKKTRLK